MRRGMRDDKSRNGITNRWRPLSSRPERRVVWSGVTPPQLNIVDRVKNSLRGSLNQQKLDIYSSWGMRQESSYGWLPGFRNVSMRMPAPELQNTAAGAGFGEMLKSYILVITGESVGHPSELHLQYWVRTISCNLRREIWMGCGFGSHWWMVGSWSQGWNHVGKGSSSSPDFKDGLEAPTFSWFALFRLFTNERPLLALPSWTPARAFNMDPVFIWNVDFCSSWNFGALIFLKILH